MELEVFQLEKFRKNHQDLFKDKPLHNFYFVKEEIQEDLIGYGSLHTCSYYYIILFPCIEIHTDGFRVNLLKKSSIFFKELFWNSPSRY